VDTKRASAALRAAGHRPTPQRLLILEVLGDADGHVTADEIYQRVQEIYPCINVSTVYRTLEALKDRGIVTETNLGEGRREFELRERGQHHHLVCKACGAVEAIDDDAFAPVRAYALERHGFRAEMEHYAVFGLCAACTVRLATPSTTPTR
jgi:Fur family transcriptional regulator, ferric uptake regulator